MRGLMTLEPIFEIVASLRRVGQDRLPFGPVLAPPRPFQPPRNPPRTRQLFTVHPRTKHPGGQPPNLLEPRHILRAPRGVLARVTTSPYLGAACSGSPACPVLRRRGRESRDRWSAHFSAGAPVDAVAWRRPRPREALPPCAVPRPEGNGPADIHPGSARVRGIGASPSPDCDRRSL